MRIFKYFEGEDTRRCLALIVDADPSLASRARSLGRKTKAAKFSQVVGEIHRQWTLFGVGEALEEVAKSGQRGPKTHALLTRCEEIEHSSPSALGDRK